MKRLIFLLTTVCLLSISCPAQDKPLIKIILTNGEVIETEQTIEDSLYVSYKKDGKYVLLSRTEIKEIQRPEFIAKGGETLAQIAARYNLQLSDLAAWNGLLLDQDAPLPKGYAIQLSRPPTPPQLRIIDRRCHLTAQEAPTIRGFTLGMPLTEALKRFAGQKKPLTDEFGITYLVIKPLQGIADSEFKGIKGLAFVFLDEKLSSFLVFYEAAPKWKDEREYLDAVQASLKLPGEWEYGSINNPDSAVTSSQQIRCDGFTLSAGIGSPIYQQPFLILEDVNARHTVLARKMAKEKKDSEARKKTFKP